MIRFIFIFCLLVSCSPIKSTSVSTEVTIPPVLVTAELHKANPKPPSREDLLKPFFKTMDLFLDEKEMFDEPRKEPFGVQQDGQLRPRWEHAYFTNQKFYYFNQITGYIGKYSVYGKNNSPIPPQVCADYLIDQLERTGGTWYQNNQRVVGKLDIRSSMKTLGLDSRRVPDLVKYFRSQPENYQFIFAVDDPRFAPDNYWGGPKVTPADGTGGLKEWLKEYHVEVGDIIIISGRAPWDHGKEIHNHSMMITGLDDSGLVDTIVGNDAWVREKKLTIEVARAPKRQVKYIIRLTNKFLESLVH